MLACLPRKRTLLERASLPHRVSDTMGQTIWAPLERSEEMLGHTAALEFVEKASYHLMEVTVFRDNKRAWHKKDSSAFS